MQLTCTPFQEKLYSDFGSMWNLGAKVSFEAVLKAEKVNYTHVLET